MVTQSTVSLFRESAEEVHNLLNDDVWESADRAELDRLVHPTELFCAPDEDNLGPEIGPDLQVMAWGYRINGTKKCLVRIALRVVVPLDDPSIVANLKNRLRVLGMPEGWNETPNVVVPLGTVRVRSLQDPDHFTVVVLDRALTALSEVIAPSHMVRAGILLKEGALMRLPGAHPVKTIKQLEDIFGV